VQQHKKKHKQMRERWNSRSMTLTPTGKVWGVY